jgi:hypothetical protein
MYMQKLVVTALNPEMRIIYIGSGSDQPTGRPDLKHCILQCNIFLTCVFWIRRIRMFLSLLDPHPDP